MDVVFIKKLVVFTTIGAYDWEKDITQKLVLDIEMHWDNKRASESDDVEHCLDYASVSTAILDYVQTRQFALVERVAEEVASLLLTEFGTLGFVSAWPNRVRWHRRKKWVSLLNEVRPDVVIMPSAELS